MTAKKKRTPLAEKTLRKPPQSSTRATLLEAFLELCAEAGAAHITLEKIAAKSGFSFGTVRYHFAGENLDIFQSAIQYVIFNAVGFVQSCIDHDRTQKNYDPVLSYISANFAWLKRYPSHGSYLSYFYSLCATEAPLVVHAAEFLGAGRTRVESLLYEGIGRGIYGGVKDLTDLAHNLHTVVTGACLVALAEGGRSAAIQERRAIEISRLLIPRKRTT